MKRITLPEVEDSARLPRWLRDAMTGYLQVAIGLGKPYAVVAPALAALIRTSDGDRVVDLAAGGGGPWPALVSALKAELGAYPTVTLTDIQPNMTAAPELERLPGVSYRRQPVSALAVPRDLEGVRAEELQALVSAIEEPEYVWRVQEIAVRGAPIPVTMIVGCPASSLGPSPV